MPRQLKTKKPVSRNCLITPKKKKKKPQSLAALKKTVQTLFNSWIRQRDSKDGFFYCISCQEYLPIEKMQAGHFFPVKGFNWLRFNELNVHGQCQRCNGFDKSSLIGYTLNLPHKIGQSHFDNLVLKSKTRQPEFTRDQLMELKIKFKTLLNTPAQFKPLT
jgi:hypothetical protein